MLDDAELDAIEAKFKAGNLEIDSSAVIPALLRDLRVARQQLALPVQDADLREGEWEYGTEYEVSSTETIFTPTHSREQAEKWVAESPTDTGLRRRRPAGPWQAVLHPAQDGAEATGCPGCDCDPVGYAPHNHATPAQPVPDVGE